MPKDNVVVDFNSKKPSKPSTVKKSRKTQASQMREEIAMSITDVAEKSEKQDDFSFLNTSHPIDERIKSLTVISIDKKSDVVGGLRSELAGYLENSRLRDHRNHEVFTRALEVSRAFKMGPARVDVGWIHIVKNSIRKILGREIVTQDEVFEKSGMTKNQINELCSRIDVAIDDCHSDIQMITELQASMHRNSSNLLEEIKDIKALMVETCDLIMELTKQRNDYKVKIDRGVKNEADDEYIELQSRIEILTQGVHSLDRKLFATQTQVSDVETMLNDVDDSMKNVVENIENLENSKRTIMHLVQSLALEGASERRLLRSRLSNEIQNAANESRVKSAERRKEINMMVAECSERPVIDVETIKAVLTHQADVQKHNLDVAKKSIGLRKTAREELGKIISEEGLGSIKNNRKLLQAMEPVKFNK